jgi:hypothetical protein
MFFYYLQFEVGPLAGTLTEAIGAARGQPDAPD